MAAYATFRSTALPMQRSQALSTINQMCIHSRTSSLASNQFRSSESTQFRSPDNNHSQCQSLDKAAENDDMSSCPNGSESREAVSRNSSLRSLPTNQQSWLSDQISTLDAQPDNNPSECQVGLAFIVQKRDECYASL